MPNPDDVQGEIESLVRGAQEEINARNAGATGEEGVAGGAEMAVDPETGQPVAGGPAAVGGEGAAIDPATGQPVAAAVAEPSPIEAATNGKFKSLEEFDSFLGEVDKMRATPPIQDEEKKVLDLYKKYGPDAYRYLGMAKTDVTTMSPTDVLKQHFALENPNLSTEEIDDGWEIELKNKLGNQALFIDFEDEESFGQGAYMKGKLQGLISDGRKGLSEFYANMIPSLLNSGQGSEEPGSYNSMPVISDEDKKGFAQEASTFTGFRPDYTEALGEDGVDLEIAVNEIPGFAEVAKQIVEDPQAFLEAEFMKDKEKGGKSLNIHALLSYAAAKAGNPLILQKYANKIGDGRYADGLAEGTGKNADEVRAKLGMVARGAEKSTDDGLTDGQRRQAEIQAKADDVTRRMSGMAS